MDVERIISKWSENYKLDHGEVRRIFNALVGLEEMAEVRDIVRRILERTTVEEIDSKKYLDLLKTHLRKDCITHARLKERDEMQKHAAAMAQEMKDKDIRTEDLEDSSVSGQLRLGGRAAKSRAIYGMPEITKTIRKPRNVWLCLPHHAKKLAKLKGKKTASAKEINQHLGELILKMDITESQFLGARDMIDSCNPENTVRKEYLQKMIDAWEPLRDLKEDLKVQLFEGFPKEKISDEHLQFFGLK